MRRTIGFSPCPNDTFIFEALINGKIDTEGLDFDLVLADVQQLNQWALEGRLDITKLSYGVVPLIGKHYRLLRAGGALGIGVGPLLIARPEKSGQQPDNNSVIAIPGENTTAHLLFTLAYPGEWKKKFMIFSDIEDALLQGKADYGVIIHENRFTYAAKGLALVKDLGTHWETVTGLPIPLGGIAVKNTISPAETEQLNRLIRKSLDYAFQHYQQELPGFITCHAQEMSEEVMRSHINLYVNSFSSDPGEKGVAAIEKFLEVYRSLNPAASSIPDPLFAVQDFSAKA